MCQPYVYAQGNAEASPDAATASESASQAADRKSTVMRNQLLAFI